MHEEESCQKTLHFPFRVGCPADCSPYSGQREGFRLTLEWYFGEPKKYNSSLPLQDQESNYSRGVNFRCSQEFVSTFQNASRIMKTLAHQQLPHLKLKFQKRMHLSLSYLCCLTKEESDAAQAVLQDMITQHQWSPITVRLRFDKIQCWHETPSSVTTIITADQPSQCQLMKILGQVEDQLKAKGIPVWIPRQDQMPFHVTLVGLRRGDNVESYRPENTISPDLSSIYNLSAPSFQ